MAEKKPSPKKPVVVRKVTKVVKPMTKPAVKNPSAPRGTGSGSGTGSVRVITPSETFMKKGKAKGSNSGASKNAPSAGRNRNMPLQEKYKAPRGTDKMIADTQGLLKRGTPPANKGSKPSKVTPKKETPKSTAKPKRKLFMGRGGGMRGGVGGGGDMFGQIK